MIYTRRIIINLLLLLKLSDIGGEIHTDKVDLSNKNLKSLSSASIEDIAATDVTNVSYSYNSISVLKTKDFLFLSQFPNLRYLFLDHNNISGIESNTLSRLPKLVHLELSYNKLGNVPMTFYNELIQLKQLRYINLKGNPIASFYNLDEFIKTGIEVDYDQPVNGHVENNVVVRYLISSRMERSLKQRNDEQLLSNEGITKKVGMNDLTGDEYQDSATDKEENWYGDAERNRVKISDGLLDANETSTVQKNTESSNILSDKYYNSIMFNFFAASVVLVVLPLAMLIYYCTSRLERCS